MSLETTVLALAEAGLIQFGQFAQPDGAVWPVALHLRWLPSYPALLRQVAAALVPLSDRIEADRLLTTADAVALGIALGLEADLPVVYPYGAVLDYTAAFALEGAYDVGHPTVLLSDVLADARQARQITALARRVGLEVRAVLAVIDLDLGARETLAKDGCDVFSIVDLPGMLPLLERHEYLPPVMRATVEAWHAAARQSA